MQELVLRLGRGAGFHRTFELATRPAEPWRSTDVGLRHDAERVLALFECWNTIGDIGAASRSTTRKVAEAEQLAALVGGEEPYRVASCWVVRHTKRNRELVLRYPEVFAARFPGSSRAWVEALEPRGDGQRPRGIPVEPGLIWCDTAGTRVFEWRRRGS